MGVFPNEYESRKFGAAAPAWVELNVYVERRPGPQDTRVLPYKISSFAMDEEFEHGGLGQLEGFLRMILDQISNVVLDELMRPYREAAKEQKRPTSMFGPLGAFLEIGRPDIIQKIALEEHEEGKGQ